MKRRRAVLQLEARRLKNMRAQGAAKVMYPKNYEYWNNADLKVA